MICPSFIRVQDNIKTDIERKFPGPTKATIKRGDSVEPDDIIGHSEVSAGQRLVKVASILGIKTSEVEKCLLRKLGDSIYKGEIIARKRGFLGGKKDLTSPTDGIINEIDKNGDLIVKFLPTPVRVIAGAKGIVAEVGEGSVKIASTVDKLTAFAGSGKLREGIIKVVAKASEFILPASINTSCQDKIIAGGALVERAAVEKAVTIGVRGIVTGGINWRDFLTFGIGSDIGLTILITEGFGNSPMGADVYGFLERTQERFAFISGEEKSLVIPTAQESTAQKSQDNQSWMVLKKGQRVRFYDPERKDFIASVLEISKEPKLLNSGFSAVTAEVKFDSGETFEVAAANLEVVG